ncbi:hypothetical protein [Chryseobacterium sp.]|uniref:hypothetical protein n=1 Tax=Chryseobacterium sp. TaxID=1871047 RepID=UPI00289ECF7A|nr:hypothetical protein [Chryseobacterium sp.]
MNYVDNSTKVSTAFGTMLTIFVNIQTEDLIKTVLLAAVGGVSSFVATLLVKFLIRNIKDKFRK